MLRRLAEVALQAVQPEQMMRSVRLPKHYRKIYVVGAGKATYGMAETLHRCFAKRIAGGYINVPVVYHKKIGRIVVQKATHPFPNAATVLATQRIQQFVQTLTPDDLLVCLWSGGGSSLFTLPRPGLSFQLQAEISEKLMRAGATIVELNTVRKHLSQVKGGQLAAATKAKVMSFVLSDVIGDPLPVIASGPTVADPTTKHHAIRILKKYHLLTSHLRKIIFSVETPKQLDSKRISNYVIGSNRLALEKICQTAKTYHPQILTTKLHGEAREVARILINKAKKVKRKPTLLLAGGETTVTVRGTGYGGGNQELALAALQYLTPGMSLLTLATDGVDGFTPKPVAGAIVRYGQYTKALDKYLWNNDSYTALRKLKAHIITGPTGTNVGDIVMIMVE